MALPGRDSLSDHTVLVAGATGRIGRAVATELAAHGVHLVLCARTFSAELSTLVEELTGRFSVRIEVVTVDVTDAGWLAELPAELAEAGIDALDGLVNCITGYDGQPVGIEDLELKQLRELVEVDLIGSLALVRELLPLLQLAPRASVVLFSSLAAIRGRPAAAHLCAVKAGLSGLALGLHYDLARRGIAVHALAPGPVGVHLQPTGAPGIMPAEVAEAVVLLLNRSADPFSGHTQLIQTLIPT